MSPVRPDDNPFSFCPQPRSAPFVPQSLTLALVAISDHPFRQAFPSSAGSSYDDFLASLSSASAPSATGGTVVGAPPTSTAATASTVTSSSSSSASFDDYLASLQATTPDNAPHATLPEPAPAAAVAAKAQAPRQKLPTSAPTPTSPFALKSPAAPSSIFCFDTNVSDGFDVNRIATTRYGSTFPAGSSKGRKFLCSSTNKEHFRFFGDAIANRIIRETKPDTILRVRAVAAAAEAYKMVEFLSASCKAWHDTFIGITAHGLTPDEHLDQKMGFLFALGAKRVATMRCAATRFNVYRADCEVMVEDHQLSATFMASYIEHIAIASKSDSSFSAPEQQRSALAAFANYVVPSVNPNGILSSSEVTLAAAHSPASRSPVLQELGLTHIYRLFEIAAGPPGVTAFAIDWAQGFIVGGFVGLRVIDCLRSEVQEIRTGPAPDHLSEVTGTNFGKKTGSAATSVKWRWRGAMRSMFPNLELDWVPTWFERHKDSHFFPQVTFDARAKGNIFEAKCVNLSKCSSEQQAAKVFESLLKDQPSATDLEAPRYPIDSIPKSHGIHPIMSQLGEAIHLVEYKQDYLGIWKAKDMKQRYNRGEAGLSRRSAVQQEVCDHVRTIFTGQDPVDLIDHVNVCNYDCLKAIPPPANDLSTEPDVFTYKINITDKQPTDFGASDIDIDVDDSMDDECSADGDGETARAPPPGSSSTKKRTTRNDAHDGSPSPKKKKDKSNKQTSARKLQTAALAPTRKSSRVRKDGAKK